MHTLRRCRVPDHVEQAVWSPANSTPKKMNLKNPTSDNKTRQTNFITSCQPFAGTKLLCRLLQQRLVLVLALVATAKRTEKSRAAKETAVPTAETAWIGALLPRQRRQIGLDVNKVLRHGALFARNPDKHWHFGARRNRRETQRHA